MLQVEPKIKYWCKILWVEPIIKAQVYSENLKVISLGTAYKPHDFGPNQDKSILLFPYPLTI